jgi:hypothetical protein
VRGRELAVDSTGEHRLHVSASRRARDVRVLCESATMLFQKSSSVR